VSRARTEGGEVVERPVLEPLTTRLEPDVMRRLRMLSAADRVSIQELVNRFVRAGLDRTEAGDA